MPNWCWNNIEITGEPEKLKNLKMTLNIIQKDDNLSDKLFESLIGIAPNITQEELENGGWYEHNISNFGTKWDIDCSGVEIGEEYVQINTETAWSPPIMACINIAKKYGVEISMYYEEPGCDFCGKTTIDSDGVHSEEDYPYQEGVYYFEGFNDWFEREFSNNDWLIDELEDGGSVLELINNNYGFLTEEEAQECAKYLEEQLQDSKQE